MSNKEEILARFRKNVKQKFDMPRLDDIKGITYPNPLEQFVKMTEMVGGKVVELEKGEDITQHPDVVDTITASQKKLLKTIKHYESRYGMLMTLHLRGLTLNAAISRLNDFIDACIREKRPYALIVCGKGIHSTDKPVIKEYTIDILRNDSRVTEYAPVINEDGDFGSIYAAFKINT